MLKQLNERRGSDEGFTLIELLIAIVVIGVLSTVVILGIGGLTDNGKAGACKASKDAATAATAVFYANHNGKYPTEFAGMTASTPKLLEVPSGATQTLTVLAANGWTLTMTPGTVGVTAVAAGPPVVPGMSTDSPSYACA